MGLKEIYQPIDRELSDVEKILEINLQGAKNKSVLEVGRYLLEAKGKRIRPALVLLSAKASRASDLNQRAVILSAAAVELIHIASLIHDDVIDQAALRHNKPTINAKWGSDTSIALGDYLYSLAFELISRCGNSDILECVSCATKSMCEGELIQVCERDNLDLLKKHYIIIVKKKTAGLFAASCQMGGMLCGSPKPLKEAFKQYGLNFGVAFQIMDDCLDLIGQEEDLGKSPGADFNMGELTLPVLNLLLQSKNKNRIMYLLRQQDKKAAFKELRQRFIDSSAFMRTREEASAYIKEAKESLNRLEDSPFKQSLFGLADYIAGRI